MDATTQTRSTEMKSARPGRRVTVAAARAPDQGAASTAIARGAEIFKKTPCAADLKRVGRHLAQDVDEADRVQLPMTILLDHGTCTGDWPTVPVRTERVVLDGNLTAAVSAGCKSEAALRKTDDRLGAFWKEAWEAGAAVRGRAGHPCGASEMQCDADV